MSELVTRAIKRGDTYIAERCKGEQVFERVYSHQSEEDARERLAEKIESQCAQKIRLGTDEAMALALTRAAADGTIITSSEPEGFDAWFVDSFGQTVYTNHRDVHFNIGPYLERADAEFHAEDYEGYTARVMARMNADIDELIRIKEQTA